MSGLHVLVIGSGSAGRRHARNLDALGCRISAVDPRADRLEEIGSEVPLVGSFAEASAAIAAGGFDGAVVASPTAFHVEQTLQAVDAGIPTLLEKPMAMDLHSAQRLHEVAATKQVPVLLGYTWRWWPALRRVRSLLQEGSIGRVLHVRCTMSAHLEDWHPWEPYQEFFMSSRALGGGALLDESHWIDLVIWLFGRPARVFATIDRLSDLDIDTDDNVDLLLDYEGGTRTVLHLDIHGRPHERSLTISGQTGTIAWSDTPNAVRVGRGAAHWVSENFDDERNDMFVGVAEDFLSMLRDGVPPPCTLTDGLEVMRIIDAARRSDREGTIVEVASP